VNEKIAGDFVGFDPDVNSAHHLPFVDRAVFLVKSAEVPCCLDTLGGDIPESTSIWKTRKSRKRLHSRWKFLPSRDNKPSKTDQEEERDGPDELGLGDVGE